MTGRISFIGKVVGVTVAEPEPGWMTSIRQDDGEVLFILSKDEESVRIVFECMMNDSKLHGETFMHGEFGYEFWLLGWSEQE